MKLNHAVIATFAAVVLGAGGGAAAVHLTSDDEPAIAGPTPPPSLTPGPSAAPTPSATPAVDQLSEENVLRERLYFDVTGHSFTKVAAVSRADPRTVHGGEGFADALPVQGLSQISSRLVGKEDGPHVVEQLAQTLAANEARTAADEIVSLVDECAAISGGDFGYGDPVTVVDEAEKKVVYFPAFDSDPGSRTWCSPWAPGWE